MNLNLLATLALLSITIAQTTTSTSAQQGTTSDQKSNPLNCTETQIGIKGQCVEVGTCASQLKFFKQKKQSQGKDQLPNKPDFNLTLDVSGNLKVALTFQNAADLATSLEGSNCLTVSLSRFAVGFAKEQIDSTAIDSVLNADNSRTWSFTILSSNFDSYLAKDVHKNFTVYLGFYAVNVNVTASSQSQQVVSFAFKFAANFTTDLSKLQSFQIEPKLRGQPVCADAAQTKCVQQAASQLIFCGTDSTCNSTANSTELVAGETYYMKQKITEDGFNDGKWRPGDANITVTADGVTKQIKPKIVNSTADGTCYEVKFRFLANNVTIASDATMSQSTSRRILTDVSDASATGTTTSSCIKTSSDSSCPTSTEVTSYNADNCDGTSCDDEGASSYQIIMAFSMIIAILI